MILSVSSGKEQNLQHLLKLSNFAMSGLRGVAWGQGEGTGPTGESLLPFVLDG